ncbi:MAG: ribonuclease III domain-containing protein [Lachnospiraceae bacterium]|nr:ribonuclease III domain-containing protein [Lachnospiraceae bacterium]
MGESIKTAGMDPAQYSPLALAYLGDAVYELIVRERVLKEGNRQVGKLHKESTKYVNAGAQADLIMKIESELTDEERAVYKRGRNSSAHAAPKNQDVIAYRKATGFEALIGWLYLRGEMDRIFDLLDIAEENNDQGTPGVKE